jgi:hypothetical protein
VGAYLNDKQQHAPFSADDYVARSIVEARTMAADAEVIGLAADYVDEAGLVHSSFEAGGRYAPGGHLAMKFHSPSRVAQAESAPGMLGAPATGKPAERCPSLRVTTTLEGNRSKQLVVSGAWRDGDCRVSFPEPIRCTVVQIWKRAIAAGAPHPALADLDLGPTTSHKARAWSFEIKDRAKGTVVFSKDFPDDC